MYRRRCEITVLLSTANATLTPRDGAGHCVAAHGLVDMSSKGRAGRSANPPTPRARPVGLTLTGSSVHEMDDSNGLRSAQKESD